jgi:hypothetical protein
VARHPDLQLARVVPSANSAAPETTGARLSARHADVVEQLLELSVRRESEPPAQSPFLVERLLDGRAIDRGHRVEKSFDRLRLSWRHGSVVILFDIDHALDASTG